MARPVSIVLVGIGGMGSVYVKALLEKKGAVDFRITGAVDPAPERCPQLGDLRALDVPVFGSLEAFYRAGRADLAIISSPIPCHADQTILALDRGSFVLCEKPVAATAAEGRRMLEAEKRSGRWVAVGFQWSFSSPVQALKKDILDGRFGRPRRLKCLYLWPRDFGYYARSPWAGRKRDDDGGWVLDGPAMNAMGHDLHNMFYVLGPTRETSAVPAAVRAELCRAYPIENYDTAALRARTTDGVEILFYVSHACRDDRGPVFSYAFEKGEATCRSRTSGVSARFADGTEKSYGVPDGEPMNKLWASIAAVRSGAPPVCGVQAALSQILCLNAAQESAPEIVGFPPGLVRREGEPGRDRLRVEGLDEALAEAYEKERLPSEMGVPWARAGREIAVQAG